MLHLIDPMVDCVFKAIFGDPAHAHLLVNLLNAVLSRPAPIVSVQITNPFNEKDFEADKLTVVDIRATDALRETFHVEAQVTNHNAMPERMLVMWADQYQGQLNQGNKWRQLRPVTSIWFLRNPLAILPNAWHHQFGIWDHQRGVQLTRHLDLHVLQLGRWQPPPLLANVPAHLADLDRWMYFLKEGRTWRTLPPALANPPQEEAMSVLNAFSDKKEDYFRYKARLYALMTIAQHQDDAAEAQKDAELARSEADAAQRELAEAKRVLAEAVEARDATISAAQAEIEAARAELEAEKEAAQAEIETAQAAKEAAQAEKEAAQAEAARLRARLVAAGMLTD